MQGRHHNQKGHQQGENVSYILIKINTVKLHKISPSKYKPPKLVMQKPSVKPSLQI